MQPEATFITVYAAALLTATVGIHKLGRANLSRTASQVRIGRRRPRDDEPRQEPDWPHSELPRFYTRISLVAASAAALLPGAELVARDNSLLATVALIVVLVAALLTISWLGISTATGQLALLARHGGR